MKIICYEKEERNMNKEDFTVKIINKILDDLPDETKQKFASVVGLPVSRIFKQNKEKQNDNS